MLNKDKYCFLYLCVPFLNQDDANHDPQWSDEQIISARFNLNGLLIGPDQLDIMKKTSLTVFEVLERAWASRNCALIDMKIEFGISVEGMLLQPHIQAYLKY